LNRSDRFHVRGAPRSRSGARAYRMKSAFAFRVPLFDCRPPA
jgi:hypothetical protein